MSIVENLAALSEQAIQERNFINHFLPFRNKGHQFDYQAVAGSVMSALMGRALAGDYDLGQFQQDCRARLEGKLSDRSFNQLLERMYFEGEGLYKVSPEFLLFKAGEGTGAGNKHLSRLFGSLLSSTEFTPVADALCSDVNFLEVELVAELRDHLRRQSVDTQEAAYLPFIAEQFSKDLRFLAGHPNYLLQKIQAFLTLYAFLYCSQLALNINEWSTLPESKPLHFILDTEKASLDRKKVRNSFPWLKEKVIDLFPLLSLTEYFNQPQDKTGYRYPLWRFVEYMTALGDEEQKRLCQDLQLFAESYRQKRGLREHSPYPDTVKEMIKTLSGLAKEVFNKRGSSQYTVNGRYVTAFEENIAQHFIQSRGRSGRVLILNQDYLLLLTNLAVGDRDQLQFQALLGEFRQRGVWFDRQSEQALISFYERVGNVERMSDSGDAVYVRKTL